MKIWYLNCSFSSFKFGKCWIFLSFSSVRETEKVVFPSVTFCKAFIFYQTSPLLVQEMKRWPDFSRQKVKQWVDSQTISKTKLFKFVHHRTEDRKFPCETINHETFGLPCTFPFVLNDCGLQTPKNPTASWNCESFNQTKQLQVLNNCTYTDDIKPWCAVHTYKNASIIPTHYGYCSENCNGEVPDSSRPEHLVGPAFESLWQSRFFDFQTWHSGHCHTYTPNETFLPGREGHFFAYLGDGAKTDYTWLRRFDVYIHSSKVTF